MIAYLKSLLPNHTPPAVAAAGRLTILQERILQWVLLIILLLGGAGFVSVTVWAVRSQAWSTVLLAFVLFAGVVAVTILRDKPYAVRAGLLLAIYFMLDIQLLLHSGMTLGSLPFYFGLIFLSGLFFGIELAAVVFGLGMAVGLTSVFLPGSAWKSLFDAIFSGQASSEVITNILAFASVGGLAILTVILMNRELSHSVRTEAEARERLEREMQEIENRVRERGEYLQRRLLETQAAAEISRTINTIHDPDQLLPQVVDLIQTRFNLYYVGIFVLDPEQRFAVLKAGSGDAGRRMIADGHRLAVSSTSMIGWVVLNKQPRVALDVGAEAVRFNNPNLPFTRSELALPIQSQGEVLGAMTVQSAQTNAFEQDDIIILQGIADSLAVALENARLYRQTQDMLDEVRQMNREYLEKAWSEATRLSGGLQFNYDNPVENTQTGGEIATHQFPLLLRDQIIGFITLESEQDQLSPEEKTFVEAITSQTAIALENARLLEESQRHAYEEQKLNQMTEQFSQASSVDDILRIAVRELGELPSAAEVSIHLISPEDQTGAGANGNNGHSKEKLS